MQFLERYLYPGDGVRQSVAPAGQPGILSLPTLERERLLAGNWKIRPAAGLYFKGEWCAVVDQAPVVEQHEIFAASGDDKVD